MIMLSTRYQQLQAKNDLQKKLWSTLSHIIWKGTDERDCNKLKESMQIVNEVKMFQIMPYLCAWSKIVTET